MPSNIRSKLEAGCSKLLRPETVIWKVVTRRLEAETPHSASTSFLILALSPLGAQPLYTHSRSKTRTFGLTPFAG
jgi:hypothetical protein